MSEFSFILISKKGTNWPQGEMFQDTLGAPRVASSPPGPLSPPVWFHLSQHSSSLLSEASPSILEVEPKALSRERGRWPACPLPDFPELSLLLRLVLQAPCA